jgi:RNA polymerase sigma-54 factor
LSQCPDGTKWLNEASSLVNFHLDLLASHDYPQLMKKLSVGRPELSEIISLIQSMNPRPGSTVQNIPVQYVIPDIYVRKLNGRWLVELNSESTPRLRINRNYAEMIRRADNSPDNNSLKEHLQEARWLIKSLQSRSETLLKVSTSIVERQKDFLEYGEQAMKPLVLHDIAEELGLHESTISRVTTNKYMHTPRGIYELKFFFSSHVNTNNGDTASSTAIRALIKKLVSEENPQKPFSDSKIANMLAEQGINVARRTIAKYREALSIPPSNERKRLI